MTTVDTFCKHRLLRLILWTHGQFTVFRELEVLVPLMQIRQDVDISHRQEGWVARITKLVFRSDPGTGVSLKMALPLVGV